MSYVYIKSEPNLRTVGFYKPDGPWEPESDHDNPDSAATRVAWLNGSEKEKENYDQAIKRAQDLAKKNVELFASLEKYGVHLGGCYANLRTANFKDMECTCGYEAAVARKILTESTPAPADEK